MTKGIITLLLLLATTCQLMAQKAGNSTRHTVRIDVTEKGSKEPIMMATCTLTPLGALVVTNADGHATISNVPQGNYTLKISYVGYEEYTTNIAVSRDITMSVQLTTTSLALKEVVVTAKQTAAGASTASSIGRQAIDHLQASSLSDLMQLIPGQEIKNTDLTQQSNLQLRTLVNNTTGAFGSSVVLDGMPLSNNGALTAGGFSSTAFVGTDLRQIAADNIANVEVIRGIPSAEYGDLTSGLVVVQSKTGVTPWQFKGKITPAMQNYSLGKGVRLVRAGIINFNFDYAKAWSDPRMKTRSYDRYTYNVGYAYNVNAKWHTDTKLRVLYARDWNGNDPDAIDDGSYAKSTNLAFSLTHNGRLSLNLPLARTLSYTVGASLSREDSYNAGYVTNSTGLLPILTATETGYYSVPWQTGSYLATGITKSRPGNLFAKVYDVFNLHAGKTNQTFKVGVDYRYTWNSGRGYYNANDSLPYRQNNNGRPRAFSDVPGLHQFAAYAEDNFVWNINRVNRLRATMGLRFTAMQPFSNVSTTAWSPRLNLMFSVARWLDLRGGIGLNSKTPGLNYLYPDKIYDDRVAVNYMPQNAAAEQLLVYHTQVYDVAYSKNLKNATTTKIELGFDVKLPWGSKLSLLAYRDKTPDGFGSSTAYTTYYSDVFTDRQGLTLNSGAKPTIDYNNPARHDLVFLSTGAVGNTNTTVNKGIEMDFDLGEIKPIHTSFQLSGAYSETKTWSTDLNARSVASAYLPSNYSAYSLTPFKVVYPSGLDYSKYRRFINTLRIITNIPSLRMVGSFTAQAIWQDYSLSYQADKNAIGWIDKDLVYHTISGDMRNGYLTMDGQYHATIPGESSVRISDLDLKYSDSKPIKQPVTWNLVMRLTKELGNIGGLSVYVNNMLYYEPYLRSNLTSTLTQRNTGHFGYGVELYFNL